MPTQKPKLTLFDSHAGAEPRTFLGKVEIILSAADAPPFEVDAIVEEEDRHLVLSAPPQIPDHPGHPISIMTDLWRSEPRPLGSVVVRPGRPPRILAVVHDLDAEPSVTPDSVSRALESALGLMEKMKVRHARFPLLGSVHGVLARKDSAALIGSTLRSRADTTSLERVWLVVPATFETGELLAALGN